jgi:hypothetical protein
MSDTATGASGKRMQGRALGVRGVDAFSSVISRIAPIAAQGVGGDRTSRNLIRHRTGASTGSKPAMRIKTRSGQMMCYQNRTT